MTSQRCSLESLSSSSVLFVSVIVLVAPLVSHSVHFYLLFRDGFVELSVLSGIFVTRIPIGLGRGGVCIPRYYAGESVEHASVRL